MRWFRATPEQPWRITIAAVGGLLVAILVAGIVGYLLNRNVEHVTEEALKYDVELEDEGDDLRAAVLDLRHYHRNIVFSGPSRLQIANYDKSYQHLLEEIDELEALGVRDPEAPQPDEVRRMAEEYYADFRPAIWLHEKGKPDGGAAFTEASDRGLVRIGEMDRIGEELDELGEKQSQDSLTRVDRATTTAKVVLLAAICALLVAGAVLAYAAVRVVNELRRLNAEQRAATEKVEAASRAKTEFIADVSHELRTPLTVLRGNAQVGLALGGEGEHAELYAEIVEESRRMSRMVEDLLFLARSDSASLPLDLETIPVETLLAELTGRAGVLASERGARLQTELSGKGIVNIDAQRIEQAVLILVDNAAKYGPEGGEILLTSSVRSGELRLGVQDHGPGIPKEELPRVFERFYRLDKARSRAMGGAGLGLPIAKTIVEAHGGHVEAVSRLGEGTKMILCLPLFAGLRPTGDRISKAASLEDR